MNMDQFDGASALVCLVYLFMTKKVLQSLIMAIFASAHQRILKNSEVEYVRQTCQTLFKMQLVMPAAMVVAAAVVGCRGCMRG